MNILTFDIEEWFHILDNESTRSSNEWKNYESRISNNMATIFRILENSQTQATFFCLGWIADKYPEIIKQISDKGYEIGSHGSMHQLIYDQTPAEFAHDIEYSIKTLEDLSGKKIKYFRAPGFSITENTKWAFEILASYGIEVDCSVFPAKRAHGGYPSYNERTPSVLKYKGIELKELPVNYTTFLNRPIIYSGGGYFRLLPYKLTRYLTKKTDYTMAYLHPRDFDASQPIIDGLPFSRRFKSYVGLKHSQIKLEKWLKDFQFIDIKTAISTIKWENAPVVNL